jgi:hypothetical protein
MCCDASWNCWLRHTIDGYLQTAFGAPNGMSLLRICLARRTSSPPYARQFVFPAHSSQVLDFFPFLKSLARRFSENFVQTESEMIFFSLLENWLGGCPFRGEDEKWRRASQGEVYGGSHYRGKKV